MSSYAQALKGAKPIFSLNQLEARRRVLNLYRAWYRQIPWIVKEYDIPVNEERCREKLRERFREHKHIDDLRSIDLLVFKGQIDLVETANMWKQKNHIMLFFKDTVNQRPKDFLSKFLSGQDA